MTTSPTSILSEKIVDVCKMLDRDGREHWWVKDECYRTFYENGYHILATGYYVPLPTPDDVASIDFNKEYFPLSRLNFDEKDATNTLKTCLQYMHELDGLPDMADAGFFWGNDQFRGLDAIAYYGMIRHLKPKTIIEIGCGYSSIIASMALKKNNEGRLVLIEPYPTSKLDHLVCDYELINSRVQDVNLNLFQSLKSDDILFIDSSHCAYTQSDVHTEIIDIVPHLPSGTKVHFHDIFFPCDYPEPWIKAGWRWNEQYMLYTFLLMNKSFRVELPNFYFWQNRHLLNDSGLSSRQADWQLGQSFWLSTL